MARHIGGSGGENRGGAGIGAHDGVTELRDHDRERRAIGRRFGDLEQDVGRDGELRSEIGALRRIRRAGYGGIERLNEAVVGNRDVAGRRDRALAQHVRLGQGSTAPFPRGRALRDLREKVGGERDGEGRRRTGGGPPRTRGEPMCEELEGWQLGRRLGHRRHVGAGAAHRVIWVRHGHKTRECRRFFLALAASVAWTRRISLGRVAMTPQPDTQPLQCLPTMSPVAEPPPAGAPEPPSARQWLDAVKLEERRGELLTAFDLAERGLAEYPDDLWLKHRAVLALARAGATEEAARRFDDYGLAGAQDEDIAALHARIFKDLALAAEGGEQRREAAHAADLYGAVFARTGGYYPAVNEATMRLVAGDPSRARELAGTVLELVGADGEDSYYAAATEAEALLLRGDETGARRALVRAAERHGGDYGALATTRRQLRTVCAVLGVDPQLLEILAGPGVVHFCGHRVADEHEHGRFAHDAVAAVTARIAEVVGRHPAGYAYGSLASGADILWAEALLASGCELHVVLPFAREEFVALSVASAGADWVERFDRCAAAATTIRYTTDDAFLGDDVLFRYGSELAMGLALLRARYLDAEARQLAVWDGGPANGAAGTAIDVASWRRSGRSATFVSPDGTALAHDTDDTGFAAAAAVPVAPRPEVS